MSELKLEGPHVFFFPKKALDQAYKPGIHGKVANVIPKKIDVLRRPPLSRPPRALRLSPRTRCQWPPVGYCLANDNI